MNKAILLGRLGADAELKVTQSGQSILKFSLATSEKYKDKTSGEQKETTQWHRCTMWGDRAAKLAPHLTKGKQIAAEGSIEYGSYEKDGVKHYTTDIKVFNIEFAGGPKGDAQQAPDQDPNNGAETDAFGDEEIPF